MEKSDDSTLYSHFLSLLPPHEPHTLAQRLVSFASENPPGNEAEVSSYAADWLSDQGFEVTQVASPQGRPNLVASLKQGRGARRLIFNAHLDVVPAGDPAGWRSPPYSAQIRDGRLYGRGAADTKGGAAAMLYGAWLIKKAGLDLGDAELILHLVSDEESGGSQGTGHLAAMGYAKADGAVVVEPTGLKVVTAEKGTLWFRITIKGVAAHAAAPHLGVNAIEKMALLMPRLKKLVGDIHHPLLGGPTLNLAVIRGGNKINTVPDVCTLELDRRCLPNEGADIIEQDLEAILADFSKDEGVAVEKERLMYAEPCEVSAGESIVRTALRSLECVLGSRADIMGISGFTDARIYAGRAGTPAILIGPGELGQAHTTNEFVAIDQLRQASLLFAMITADFFGAV